MLVVLALVWCCQHPCICSSCTATSTDWHLLYATPGARFVLMFKPHCSFCPLPLCPKEQPALTLENHAVNLVFYFSPSLEPAQETLGSGEVIPIASSSFWQQFSVRKHSCFCLFSFVNLWYVTEPSSIHYKKHSNKLILLKSSACKVCYCTQDPLSAGRNSVFLLEKSPSLQMTERGPHHHQVG